MKTITSIRTNVDIPLFRSIPVTEDEVRNENTMFSNYVNATTETNLAERNPNRDPFEIITNDRFVQLALIKNIKAQLQNESDIRSRDISSLICKPEISEFSNKEIYVPNKDSDLYTSDVLYRIAMAQFVRNGHNAFTYELAVKYVMHGYYKSFLDNMERKLEMANNEYNRTHGIDTNSIEDFEASYRRMMNDANPIEDEQMKALYDRVIGYEKIYNKYAVYEHAAPDPFTITIPYIPAGTTITFDR